MFKFLASLPGIGKHKTVLGSVATVATIFAPALVSTADTVINSQEALGIYTGVGLVHKLWKFVRPG